MSLRYQINLRIFFSALGILILGGSIAIWQARNAVNKEVKSSINLVVQLIKIGFSHNSINEIDELSRFNTLKETRHLSIQLKAPSGEILHYAQQTPPPTPRDQPPHWFIHLVEGQSSSVEHQITAFDGKQFTLIIQANPLDEITEVWQESRNFLVLLLLLTLLTFLVVHLAFDQALKAIAVIVNALKIIETGQYQHQLPAFSTQEYDSIARAINHTTAELHKTQQENRALTQHSLAIQEEERQRLSQELHDELGQSLTAIKVMAATAGRSQAGLNIKSSTDAIIGVCDHLMTVVQSMMRQLHPLMLTELGLKATLSDLLTHWMIRTPPLTLVLNCPDAVNTLAPTISIHIFRIVQEGLTNIIRHAHATEACVTLSLDHQAHWLHLHICDNGVGCVSEQLNSGFGLLGMRERINSLGGDLCIESLSQSHQGMTLIARIPLR